MKNNQHISLVITCVLGILISWTLLIIGTLVIQSAEISAITAITNGLLLGNAIISSIIYIKVLQKIIKR